MPQEFVLTILINKNSHGSYWGVVLNYMRIHQLILFTFFFTLLGCTIKSEKENSEPEKIEKIGLKQFLITPANFYKKTSKNNRSYNEIKSITERAKFIDSLIFSNTRFKGKAQYDSVQNKYNFRAKHYSSSFHRTEKHQYENLTHINIIRNESLGEFIPAEKTFIGDEEITCRARTYLYNNIDKCWVHIGPILSIDSDYKQHSFNKIVNLFNQNKIIVKHCIE